MATNIFEMCFEAYNEISSFHIVFKLDVGDLKHNIRLHIDNIGTFVFVFITLNKLHK